MNFASKLLSASVLLFSSFAHAQALEARLLLDDQSEYQQYLDVYFPYVHGKIKANLLERIKAFGGTKVMAAGEVDHLVPARVVEKDAKRLGCKYEVIAKAPHFVLFEQPEKTAELFEKYFLKK